MNFKESFKKSIKDINPMTLGVGALTGLNSAIGFNNRGAGAVAQGLSQIKTGNPFVDMGIQGASMLLNQFGYNVNEQLKNDIESNIAENNSFQSNAWDWDSFLSNYNSAPTMKYWTPDQLVKRGIFNTSGGRGLINSLAQQQAQSGNWVADSLANNANNIMQDDINNDWRNFNNPINIGAKGGLLHTLGTEWDNGLTFINNGGTHEENPNQGVQVGVDHKGTPNLVEEGEVIWNDYVFSNRLKVPKETVNKYKLGGSKKDYTYAEVVEKLQRASEERPNDPLEKRYLEEMLAMLMEEQEMVRQQEQAQQQLAMQEALQDPAVQEQLMQEQLAQENMMQENMMGLPMMAANGGELYGLGGNLFQNGSFLNKKQSSKAVGHFKSIAGAGNVTTSAARNGGYYKTKYVVNTKFGQTNIYEDHNGKLYTEENAKEGAGGVIRYKKSILIRDPKSTKELQQRITKQGLRWPKKVTGRSGSRYNKDTGRYDIPIYQTYTHPGNGSAIIIEDQATRLRRDPSYRGNLPEIISNNTKPNNNTDNIKVTKKVTKKVSSKLSPPLFSEPEDPRWLEFTDPIIGPGSAYGMLNFAGNPIEMGESYYNPPTDNMVGVNSIPIPTSESMSGYSGLYPSIQQPRDPELNNLLQDLVAWNKARKEAGLSGEEAYDMQPYRDDISTALNAISLKELENSPINRVEEVTTVENQETNEGNESTDKQENEVVRPKTINYTSTMSPFGNNPTIALNPLGELEFPKIGVASKYSYGGAIRNTFEKKENNPSLTNELASKGNFYDLGSFLGRMSPTVQQYLIPEIIMPASILSTTLSSKKKTSKSTNAASPKVLKISLKDTTTLPTQSKEKQNKAVKSTTATTPVTTITPPSTTTATPKKARQSKERRKLPVGDFDLDMASLGINPNSIYSLDPEEFNFPPIAENGFWGSKALKIAKDAIEQAQQNVENTEKSDLYVPDKIDETAELAELGITDNDIIGAAAEEDIDSEDKKGTNWKSDPSYLKNTNAFASLAQVLSDAFGRTNTPDHSYANALQAAAANYPRIYVSPIGDRQAYTPRDIFNTLINPLYANSAGISSNLANSGNRGTQTAQQIALDRNLADATGKAYATGVEGELASKKAIADYNANIGKINATIGMQAQQQNAANRQRYINYLAQALAWKQQEDTQAAMARAANREALANNLTTIGQNIYDANAGNAITRYQRDPNRGSIIFIG